MSAVAVPAILGGTPVASRSLPSVRVQLPPLNTWAARLEAAMAQGIVTNGGPYVLEFQRALARFLGVPAVAVTCNGQAALMLMLRACGISSGEVVVPSYTFCGTAHAVRWVGAEPVFADIGCPGSFHLDAASVEACITARTVAIMGVDVYGIPCDYEALQAVADRHGIPVMYDSAPAFGACAGGRRIGAQGKAQAFSFHATKVFTTIEGGCVSSGDERIATSVADLARFGQDHKPDCSEVGMNAKMNELAALIGLEQLDGFARVPEHRASIARRMRTGLEDLPGLTFASVPPQYCPVWLHFPVVVSPAEFGLHRDHLTAALAAENVHVSKYYERPCHMLSCYSATRHRRLPNTEYAAANIVSLPLYNDMTLSEADLIVEAIRRVHRHANRVRQALTSVI